MSIEVFSDLTTTAEQMFRQGKQMYSWIPTTKGIEKFAADYRATLYQQAA